MPDDGDRRPKNGSKEPEKDDDQRDRMPDDFNQGAAGPKKNRGGYNSKNQSQLCANHPDPAARLSHPGLLFL